MAAPALASMLGAAATTNAETLLADKVPVLLATFAAAIKAELAAGGTLTPQQMAHYDEAVADAMAGLASFITSMTVT